MTEIIGQKTLFLLNIRFESRLIWSPDGDRFNLRYLELFLNYEQTFSNEIPGTEAVAATVAQLMREIYEECQKRELEYELVVKAKVLLMLANLGRHYEIANLPSTPHTSKQHLLQFELLPVKWTVK